MKVKKYILDKIKRNKEYIKIVEREIKELEELLKELEEKNNDTKYMWF